MKFGIRKFSFIAIILLALVISTESKERNKFFFRHKSTAIDYQKIADSLFSSNVAQNAEMDMLMEPDEVFCDEKLSPTEETEETKTNLIGGLQFANEKAKDKWTPKLYGQGPSAYLFDFLDELLGKPIILKYQEIYNNAIKVPEKQGVHYSQNTEQFKQKIGNDQAKIEIFEQSISEGIIANILTEWKWNTRDMTSKDIIEKYDFDSDGRLNKREFLLAMIDLNYRKNNMNGGDCINCAKEIVNLYLDKIYDQFDPCKEGFTTAEIMWENLRYLNRLDNTHYNIYQCSIRNLRTSSVNDLVLKSGKNGKITKSQFVKGILLAYWNRNTSSKEIIDSNQLNDKVNRWGPDGLVDLGCEALKKSRS